MKLSKGQWNGMRPIRIGGCKIKIIISELAYREWSESGQLFHPEYSLNRCRLAEGEWHEHAPTGS
jgi:hypothetical protein